MLAKIKIGIKRNIFLKDPNHKLGTIRLLCGILGALSIAYLIIMIIAKFLSSSIFENIVIGVMLLPVFWSIFALWIIMSTSKINAILKTIIPFILLCSITYYLG